MSFILNTLLPRTCLICHVPCSHSLCEECSHQLIPLDLAEAQPKKPGPFRGLAAALPLTVMRPILASFKQTNPNLARPLASFLVTQLLTLEWPTPDVLCYVPQDLPHRLMSPHNCALLLAKETARLLERPLVHALTRHPGDFPQTGQSPEQRRTLTAESFSVRRPHRLVDKDILLVDDFMETGTTMRCCGEVLRNAFPQRVFGLCVAMPQVDED